VSSLAIEFAANSVDNNAAFVGCGLNVANDATSCNFANSVNLSTLVTPIFLTDGSTHTAEIQYLLGTLTLTLETQVVLSQAVNLASYVGNPALVGFIAATGDNTSPAQYGLTETARIFNWDLTTTEGTGAVVPEPSGFTMLRLALAWMVWLTRRKHKA
jgi:hypothetical protein